MFTFTFTLGIRRATRPLRDHRPDDWRHAWEGGAKGRVKDVQGYTWALGIRIMVRDHNGMGIIKYRMEECG